MRPLVDRVESRKERGGRPVELPIPWKQLVYDHRPVPIARFRLADPQPNAPLLKRIVRHPYALEPKGTRRVQLIDLELTEPRPSGVPDREPVRIVFAAMRTDRARASIELPELPRRGHPFARQRTSAEEAKWAAILGEGACTTI